MLPYGNRRTNYDDEYFMKLIRMVLNDLESESEAHCKNFGILTSYLRITKPYRVLALIDSGTQWSRHQGNLILKHGSSVHLSFTIRGVDPGIEEVWVLFTDEKTTYREALARSMQHDLLSEYDFRQFDEPFAITVPAVALDDWANASYHVSPAAQEYVKFELHWIKNLGLVRKASPLFGHTEKKTGHHRECLFILPESYGDDLWNRLSQLPIDSNHHFVDSVSRASWSRQPDSLIQLWWQICTAEFVLADITGHDPMVFYSLGLAHGYGIHVILLMRSGTEVPFDIIRSIPVTYDNIDDDLPDLPDTFHQVFEVLELTRSRGRPLASPLPNPSFLRDPKLAFVLMPFSRPWSDHVWTNLIQPVFTRNRFICHRADNWTNPEVMKDIWEGIASAEIVVADLTDRNPNVFYELGLAHAIRKDFLLLSQNIDHIPVGLRRYRVMLYDSNEELTKDFERKVLALAQKLRPN